MTFYLVTCEYNSMAGSMQPDTEDRSTPLLATTITSAVIEGRQQFAARERYNSPGQYGEEFPQQPRLVVYL